MSLNLPITISAEKAVSEALEISKQALERIEAWANFETMKASWYEDEDLHVRCQITLVSDETFNSKFASLTLPEWQVNIEEKSARKLVTLAEKQHVIIAINESYTSAQPDKAQASSWIGSDVQINVQALIRKQLLMIAKEHQLDPID
ncbi:MAG: hypothetical protein CL811_01990 [Colwelliaceae bacterium]|nr:hypothetical protein [Colwelliaceae bacterium]